MADNVQNLEIRVAAKDEASGTLAKIGKDLANFKKAEGGSDFFDNLRNKLGRRSALGEGAELVEGATAGPVGGLIRAGNVLKELTGKGAELADQFRQGQISAGGMVEQIAHGIPVLGSLLDAGGNFIEILTGARAEAEQTSRAVKEQQEYWDAVGAAIKASAAEYAAFIAQSEAAHGAIRQNTLAPAARSLDAINREESTAAASILNQANSDNAGHLKAEIEAQLAKVKEADAAYREINAHPGLLTDVAGDRSGVRNQAATKLNEQQEQLERLKKQKEALDAKRSESAQAALAQNAQKAQAQRDELNRTNVEKEKQYRTSSRNEIESLDASADQTRLQRGGHALQAELAQLDRALDAKNKAYDEESRKRQAEVGPNAEDKDHVKLAKDIADETERLKAAAQREHDEKVKTARQGEADRGVDSEAKLRQMRMAGLEAEVAAGNKAKTVELERLRIQDEFATKIAENARDKRAADEAHKSAFDKTGADLSRQEKGALADLTSRQLEDAKTEALKQQAALGNKLAADDLKRLEVAKTYREQLGKINGLLADSTITAAERSQANATKAEIEASEKQALAAIGAHPLSLYAALNTQGGPSGAAAAAAERNAYLGSLPGGADDKKDDQKAIAANTGKNGPIAALLQQILAAQAPVAGAHTDAFGNPL